MMLSADWLMQAGLRATLLLTGLYLLWRFLPASRPRLRRHVLLGMAAGLLAAPWLSGWWALDRQPSSAGLPLLPDQIAPATVFSWSTLAAGVWLTGSALALARLGLASWSLHQLIRRARPWAGAPALPDLPVLESSAISGPCVAGGRRPVLLLPDHARHWNPAQWNMVLAHETQHLHQQDLRLSWLIRLVHCLYWWHPLTHWLTRQFHAESEALCDRAVLARSGSTTRDYVEFLLSLNATSSSQPALTAGMALTSPLGQRLERLIQPLPASSCWWTSAAALALLTTLTFVGLSLRTVPPPPNPAPPIAPALIQPDPGETNLRLSANPFPGD